MFLSRLSYFKNHKDINNSFLRIHRALSGTDALRANIVQAAGEQQVWLDLKQRGDELALKLLEVNVFCVHHQASLARKPSILQIDGLATALVRMSHSQRTTKFQTKLETFFDRVSANVKRNICGQLPHVALQNIEVNRKILDVCGNSLSEQQREDILFFFNRNWAEDMHGFTLSHWCAPGCCSDGAAASAKCKALLEIMIGRPPETPLLYRWKGFEPCVEFAYRGLAVHKILVNAFSFILGKSGSDDADIPEETLPDADDPDVDPATSQRIRMNKTWKYFSDSGCLVSCLNKLKHLVSQHFFPR